MIVASRPANNAAGRVTLSKTRQRKSVRRSGDVKENESKETSKILILLSECDQFE